MRPASNILDALDAEIGDLTKQSLAQLRDTWKTRLRMDPPPIQSRDILLGLLAWQLQANAIGNLDIRTERRLAAISQNIDRDPEYEPQLSQTLSPGVVLTREWKGVIYRVTVTEAGFRDADRDYRSLSEVARAITGTRWSGPGFLGSSTRPSHEQSTHIVARSIRANRPKKAWSRTSTASMLNAKPAPLYLQPTI